MIDVEREEAADPDDDDDDEEDDDDDDDKLDRGKVWSMMAVKHPTTAKTA